MLVTFLFLLNLLLLTFSSSETLETCNVETNGVVSCPEDKHIEYVNYLKSKNWQKSWTHSLLTTNLSYNCNNIASDNWCNNIANNGLCEKKARISIFKCPKSCGYCHMHDRTSIEHTNKRCSRNPLQLPAVNSSTIDIIMNRALKLFKHYSPKVHSKNPWLVTFDNVFNKREADQLIRLGGRNFRRSVDTGKLNKDGILERVKNSGRTSMNDWCVTNCWEDPIIQNIINKIENLTLIPREHSEYFQVLKYEIGERYHLHHDYIPQHLKLPIGPRVFTAFLYLNNVEKGGGTKFNSLDVTVMPKLGRVALWPSVLSKYPLRKDYRTQHEALPPIKGTKYAANMWLHMYNFHQPFKVQCTG